MDPTAQVGGAALEAAEQFVAHTVDAAERSLARRIGLRGLRLVLAGGRVLWWLMVAAYFAFGLTVLATRYYLLPHIGDWRPQIEAAAAAALHAPVTVAHIEADWQGLRPRLHLGEVAIRDAQGNVTLSLPQVDIVMSWTSVLAWQPHMQSLLVRAPEITVRRLRNHRFDVGGFVIDPLAAGADTAFLDWLLAQGRIRVLGARVHYVDELAAGGPGGAAGAGPQAAGAAATAAQAPSEYDLSEVDFVLLRGLTGHRFSLQLHPPASLSGPIDLRGQFSHAWGQPTSLMTAWSGRLFLQFDDADLARLQSLVGALPVPERLDRAHGSMRAWMDFSQMQVTRLRADVALKDVAAQWRPDLDPMRLDTVQGRITQTLSGDRDSETQEVALTGLRLEGPEDLHLPPSDLLFRTTRKRVAAPALPGAQGGATAPGAGTEQSSFEANRIVLKDWSRLARQFPLPPDWLQLIERTAAQGTLENVHASWDGPEAPPHRYALRARFAGLGFTLSAKALEHSGEEASRGAAPGAGNAAGARPETAPPSFENLSGSIDTTQDSGSMRLDSSAARVQLAPVFGAQSILLDSLGAQLRWQHGDHGAIRFDLDALSAANEDLDLRASGLFRSGGGEAARIELNGNVNRARVGAVPRYVPVFLPPATRAWLQGALLDGTVSGGSFSLRGDPTRFPFVDPRAGEFHARLQVRGGRIDVAPVPPGDGAVPPPANAQHWPQLTDVDADVTFERDRMSVSARRAHAYGYDLADVAVQIPHLATPGAHLLVDAKGSGSLSEMMRYVSDSPVNAWTGNWLGAVKANGPSRLALRLDIPLERPNQTVVAGTVALHDDALVLRPDVAPFSAVQGQVEFTQRGFRLIGINAGFLGGEVRVNGDTRPDGEVLIQGGGTATPQGLHAMLQPAVLRHLLDASQGTLRYSASLAFRADTMALKVDSDLVGLTVNLPAPFRKTAGESLPLRVEIVPTAGAEPPRDTLRVTLAGMLDAELLRVAGAAGRMNIERGAIAVGGRANLPESGVLLFVDEPQLDLDRWQALLGPPGPEAAGAGAVPAPAAEENPIDQVVLRARSLTVAGKVATNVALSARRDGANTWAVDVDSDQASGFLRWTGSDVAGHAHLLARLAKLDIPERDRKQVSDLLATPPTDYPELDIVADRFQLGQRDLGRLELAAQSTGQGPDRKWNLVRLALTNPDGRITGSGAWQRGDGATARRMSLKLAVNCSNVGNMLERFGMPGHIKNGSGKLEGDLSWVGTPFSVDYPSLSGTLRLSAEKGQVLQLDAGAARLLAVFSFQSVFNLVTGDLREFSAGVAFDSVNASATVAKGILTTDDFLMKGNAGAGRIKGSLDLVNETQNLEVVVVPEVSASAATLAYAAFVNPAIGLSTFIGSFVLNKPLSAIFTRAYSVTGPWSDPQMTRIKPAPAEPPPQSAAQP
jgi:uncharacterized protein (TIGR02099 family)